LSTSITDGDGLRLARRVSSTARPRSLEFRRRGGGGVRERDEVSRPPLRPPLGLGLRRRPYRGGGEGERLEGGVGDREKRRLRGGGLRLSRRLSFPPLNLLGGEREREGERLRLRAGGGERERDREPPLEGVTEGERWRLRGEGERRRKR
jgi:hypothetical protein